MVVGSLAVALVFAEPVEGVTLWSDPQGDVALAGADLVSGLATVDRDTVHLRASLAEMPFPETATHFIEWCMDLDGDPTTGSVCGGINGYSLAGADAVVSLRSVPGSPFPQDFFLLVNQWPPTMLDTTDLNIDAATHTVCVAFPLPLLSDDDGAFHYEVGSIFGGSEIFGANDAAPDAPGFDTASGYFSSESGDPGLCGASGDSQDPSEDPGDSVESTGEPTNETGDVTGDTADPPGNTVTQSGPSTPAQLSPWWIVPILVVSFALAVLGVARQRRKRPPPYG